MKFNISFVYSIKVFALDYKIISVKNDDTVLLIKNSCNNLKRVARIR